MSYLLLENGDNLLQENGDELLLDVVADGVHIELGLPEDGSTVSWRTPLADIPWFDLTGDDLADGQRRVLQAANTRRGRARELERFHAGTCSFTINNSDRGYDPTYTDGPWFGRLVPGVPVRVYKMVDETAYVLFTGYVDDWPQSYDLSNNLGTVSINATDLFGILSRTRMPGSVLEYEILADAATLLGYWPLDERAGTTLRDRSGNGRDLALTTTASSIASDLRAPSGQTYPGLNFERNESIYALSYDEALQATTVLEAVAQANREAQTTAGDLFAVVRVQNPSGGPAATRGLFMECADADSVECRFASPFDKSSLLDAKSRPRHAVTGASTSAVHVDGVDATADTVTSPAFVKPEFTVGGGKSSSPDGGGSPTDLEPFDGSLAMVAAFSSLSDARRVAHGAAFAAPWDGDTTGERLANLLDVIAHPSADRDIATGYTILGPAVLGSAYALDLLQRVEASEQGRMFIAADGTFTFLARYHDQLVATTSGITFTDDGADSPYSAVVLNAPRDFVFNKVTVTADNAAAVTVEDADSIEAYGESEVSVDAPLLTTPNLQRSLAEFVLGRYKDPHTRVFGLRVPLHKPGMDAATILGLEIGSRVTFERTPQNVGFQYATDQIVEGIDHEITEKTHWVSLYLSPADTVTYAQFGVSTFGEGIFGY